MVSRQLSRYVPHLRTTLERAEHQARWHVLSRQRAAERVAAEIPSSDARTMEKGYGKPPPKPAGGISASARELGIPKSTLHEAVQIAAIAPEAKAAAVEGRAFGDLLAADPRVTAHLDAKAIAALLDPTAYTGLCAEMAREAAARARDAVRGL